MAKRLTGMPMVRPLFLVDPKSPAAWSDWQTYEYGPDIVVSPLWQKGQRTKQVYLPSGAQWGDPWHPDKSYGGGRTITVAAEWHQLPILTRVGSRMDLGDLSRRYAEAKSVAAKRPDLKALDAEVAAWFEKFKQAGGQK